MADLFEPRERAKYQGYSAAVFTLSSVIGPVAGGIIAQSIGWEYIFLINLPIGIAAIAVLVWQMPNFSTGRQPRIDVLGENMITEPHALMIRALAHSPRAVASR